MRRVVKLVFKDTVHKRHQSSKDRNTTKIYPFCTFDLPQTNQCRVLLIDFIFLLQLPIFFGIKIAQSKDGYNKLTTNKLQKEIFYILKILFQTI